MGGWVGVRRGKEGGGREGGEGGEGEEGGKGERGERGGGGYLFVLAKSLT